MVDKSKTLVLSGADIQTIIQEVGINTIMDELIHHLSQAFVNLDRNNTITPVRSGFSYEEPNTGLIEWMPLRSIENEEVVMKLVGYHPDNSKLYKIPSILSTIYIFDTLTGHLKSIIDGVLPTALRTGAASAIASKLFGKPESNTLGLIGCGAQAVTQLHAISRVFNIENVLYYDTDQLTLQSFKDRASEVSINATFRISTIQDILSSSDIISTATSIGVDEGPLFTAYEIKDWLHINAVGSDFPGKIEIPKSLLDEAFVTPDTKAQAIIEGECQQLENEQIQDDIIECLKSANQLSHLKQKLTVFDSTGFVLEDQVVAELFLSYAEKLNIGKSISIESTSSDEKNPYAFLKQFKKA